MAPNQAQPKNVSRRIAAQCLLIFLSFMPLLLMRSPSESEDRFPSVAITAEPPVEQPVMHPAFSVPVP